MVPIRPNINDGDNSDVSDEENISRAARSIESPPESPQGTHFESPPASPDPENKPGTPSPIQSPEDSASYGSPVRSPDSQADSRLKNESPPRSPDSYLPRSPNCFGNRTPPSEPRSQSPTSNYPRSPSPVESLLLNQSPKNKSLDSIQSPDSHSPQSPQESQRLTSPSPRSPSPPYKPTHRNESPQEQNSQSPPRDPRWFKSRSPSNSPQSTNQQRTRRDSFNSDDGRSNISSASSFGSPQRSPANPPEPTRELKSHVEDIKNHADDLSDVSDLECMSDDELEKPECKENGNVRGAIIDQKKDFTTGLEADTEQLDFEAEEKEEGECDAPQPAAKPQPVAKTKGEKKEEGAISEGEDEGELKGDDLEEGEITDEGENRPEETEPRPVCRFYHRGQCTWGANCRFIHPGVTDKGNYTMFEMVRPLVPVNGPPMPMPMYGPPMDPYRPMMDRPPMMPMGPQMGPPMGPQMGPPMYQPPPPRKEEVAPPVVVESAWERGLRQAKEMLRKSSKRKETEVDFEEKKMNLSIGQDDLDKENDYYTRAGSPVLDNLERYSGKGEEKRYRTMSDRFDDYGGGPEGFYYQRNTEQVWHQRPHYDESMRGVYSRSSSKYYSNSQTRTSRERERDKEYYSSSKSSKKYSQREVIVQRPEKTASWKDDSPPAKPARYAEGRSGGRGDEWADPWMRSKTSPLSRKRSRKASYSSGSSYSSSSSRSSSHSSSSSYSRSRSRSRSSRSRSRSKKPSKLSPPRRLMRAGSPLGRGLKVAMMPTMPSTEKKATAMLMNPPPPSPRSKGKTMVATNPSPPIERVRATVPTSTKLQKAASAVAAAMRSARSRSKSSRSSGSSDSSGSSSDSSDTSLSSSSSSRPASPSLPVRQKRIVIDERLALAQAMNMKVKAMDALKLSGQKQQIKLTLKGSGAGERTTSMPIVVGKKRPAESPPMDFSPPKAGGKVMLKKTAPSRREELLKQLKAVEDAIARKRSKIS